MEILALVERQHQLQELARQAASLSDVLLEVKREFWGHWTDVIMPEPGQQCGTSLLPENVVVSKGAQMLTEKDVRKAKKAAIKKGISLDEALRLRLMRKGFDASVANSTLRKHGVPPAPPPSPADAEMAKQYIAAALTYRMTGNGSEVERRAFEVNYGFRQRIGQQPGTAVSSALGLLTARL